MSWQIIGYALFASLAAAAIFLAFASYARVEVVRGTIVLDRGTAAVKPSRSGVVRALHVSDNQLVEAGTALAHVQAEEMLEAGSSAPGRILKSLNEQEAGLASQSRQTLTAGAAEEARFGAQIAGLTQELGSLERQIQVQRDLVASAVKELEVIQEVAQKGYISRRDVILREETVLARRQQLAQLEQSRASRAAVLADARRAIAQVRAQVGAQAAGLLSTRAELDQRRAEAEAGEGYVLTAPIRGRVTALTARPGQAVATGDQLMIIVPTDAAVRAELHVPTQAAGFLEPRQEVRLAIDAFPYQRFGTVTARIEQISATTVAREDATGRMVPVYLVTAVLAEPWISAFGERQPLTPGMMLTARIVTDRQSLLEWLFQPLFAVRNR